MLHTTTLLHLVPAIGCIQRIPFVTVIGHVPFTARRHSASARRTNGRGFHCEIAVSNGTNHRRVHQTTGLPNFHPRKASWSLWKDIYLWLLFYDCFFGVKMTNNKNDSKVTNSHFWPSNSAALPLCCCWPHMCTSMWRRSYIFSTLAFLFIETHGFFSVKLSRAILRYFIFFFLWAVHTWKRYGSPQLAWHNIAIKFWSNELAAFFRKVAACVAQYFSYKNQ